MTELVPVDHDPFAGAPESAKPTTTPVDYDPFTTAPKIDGKSVKQSPCEPGVLAKLRAAAQDMFPTPAKESPRENTPLHRSLAAQTGAAMAGAPLAPDTIKPEKIEKLKDVGEGFAAGVPRGLLGAAQMIPTPRMFSQTGQAAGATLGDKATEWNNYLKTIGNPAANTMGSMMLPGMAGGKIAGLVGKGVGLLGATAPGLLRSIPQGMAGMATMGALEPSSEVDPEKRAKEKLSTAGWSGLAGGLLPVGGAALLKGGKALGKGYDTAKEAYKSAWGAERDKAVRGVKELASSSGKEAVATEDAALAAHEKELDRLAKARAQIDQSEKVRADKQGPLGETIKGRNTLQADDPKNKHFADAQKLVTERLRERVRASEAEALKRGVGAEDARTYARNQEAELMDLEAAAKKIASEQSKLAGNTAPEELGARVRKEVEEINKKYDKIREEQSGFGKALAGAKGRAPVDTRAAIEYIDSLDNMYANQGTKSTLAWIRKELGAAEKAESGDAASAAGEMVGGSSAIPLAKADSLRKTINTAIRTKRLAVDNNQQADAGEAGKFLGEIQGRLLSSAAPSGSEYGTALKKWRDLSRGALDLFEGKKALLKDVVATDPVSRNPLMNDAKVLEHIVSGAKGGFPAVQKLLVEKPELRDALREHLRTDLFGSLGAEKNLTPNAIAGWLRDKRAVLKQSGLYDEFAALKAQRDDAARTIDSSKEIKKYLGGEAAAREAEAATANQTFGKTSGLLKRAEGREVAALTGAPTNPNLPVNKLPGKELRTSEDIAKEAADKVSGRVTEVESSIESMSRQRAATARARESYQKFDRDLRIAADRNDRGAMISESEKFVRALEADKHIDSAAAEAAIRQIKQAADLHKDTEKMRSWIARVISAIGIGAGISFGASHIGGEAVKNILPH